MRFLEYTRFLEQSDKGDMSVLKPGSNVVPRASIFQAFSCSGV